MTSGQEKAGPTTGPAHESVTSTNELNTSRNQGQKLERALKRWLSQRRFSRNARLEELYKWASR